MASSFTRDVKVIDLFVERCIDDLTEELTFAACEFSIDDIMFESDDSNVDSKDKGFIKRIKDKIVKLFKTIIGFIDKVITGISIKLSNMKKQHNLTKKIKKLEEIKRKKPDAKVHGINPEKFENFMAVASAEFHSKIMVFTNKFTSPRGISIMETRKFEKDILGMLDRHNAKKEEIMNNPEDFSLQVVIDQAKRNLDDTRSGTLTRLEQYQDTIRDAQKKVERITELRQQAEEKSPYEYEIDSFRKIFHNVITWIARNMKTLIIIVGDAVVLGIGIFNAGAATGVLAGALAGGSSIVLGSKGGINNIETIKRRVTRNRLKGTEEDLEDDK